METDGERKFVLQTSHGKLKLEGSIPAPPMVGSKVKIQYKGAKRSGKELYYWKVLSLDAE